MSERVIVVGGGVIGLSVAVALAEAKRFRVEIVAAEFGLASLSRVPAASFYPFAVDHEHVAQWLRVGLARFLELASDPAAGIVLRHGIEIEPRPIAGKSPGEYLLPPDPGHRSSDPSILSFKLPIIDVPRYLPWLQRRAEALGVVMRRARFESLDELDAESIVVVCAGSGARALVGDPELTPTLGQLVRISSAGIDRFALDERDLKRPTYVVPRVDDVVVGSFDLPYDVDRLGLEPPSPDAERTRDIVARAARLEPKVAEAEVLESYCGFRPRRRRVRVEIDDAARERGRRIVHAYGHGGGGVTLSWGTAARVVELVASLAKA